MKRALYYIEMLIASWVMLISIYMTLNHHSWDAGRYIYLMSCLICASFLFGLSKITSAGGGESSCKDQSGTGDWWFQEFIRNGDSYMWKVLLVISIITFMWPYPVHGFVIVTQFFSSFSSGLYIFLVATTLYRLEKSAGGMWKGKLCYRIPEQAKILESTKWR